MSRYTISINIYDESGYNGEPVHIAGTMLFQGIDGKLALEHALKRTGLSDEVVRQILDKVKEQ